MAVPAKKECRVFKQSQMKNYNRELLVLYKDEVFNEELIQNEVENLHLLLLKTEKDEIFCGAHELVCRNRITARAKTILRATSEEQLSPFYFLINKN